MLPTSRYAINGTMTGRGVDIIVLNASGTSRSTLLPLYPPRTPLMLAPGCGKEGYF